MSSKSNLEAEADLMDRLCKRDPRALVAIYDSYARSVYSLCVRITHDQSTAEDLVQELFLRLWNRARLFNSKRINLGVWLLSVARDMALDQVRSGSARFAKRLHPMEHMEQFSYSVSLDGSDSMMARIINFKVALSSLQVHERRVLELAYCEGYPQTEIANLLERPLDTVKSWMQSALTRLRLSVEGHDDK